MSIILKLINVSHEPSTERFFKGNSNTGDQVYYQAVTGCGAASSFGQGKKPFGSGGAPCVLIC